MTSYGRQSEEPDGLGFPIGVNVLGDGRVVVCDTRHNMVKIFNRDRRLCGVASVRQRYICCMVLRLYYALMLSVQSVLLFMLLKSTEEDRRNLNYFGEYSPLTCVTDHFHAERSGSHEPTLSVLTAIFQVNLG